MHTWRTNKQGKLIHDGDCYVWVNNICTCGLIHHLMPLAEEEIDKLYGEKFWEDSACHEEILQSLRFCDDKED